MNKTIKLVICVVIFFLCINNKIVKASDEYYKSITEITEEELINCARNFSKEFVKNENVKTGTITPIYDMGFELIGYSVPIYVDNTPFGYVNFDFLNENFISDFVLQAGAQDLYKEIESHIELYGTNVKTEKKLIRENALDYSIPCKVNNKVCYYSMSRGLLSESNYEKVIKKSQNDIKKRSSSNTVYNQASDIFSSSYISGSTILDGPGYTSKYSSTYSIILQSNIIYYTSRYACAVLALTEIAGQEGVLVNIHPNMSDNIKDSFLALWVYTNTYVDNVVGSVIYGGTYDSDLSTGMETYCTIRGKSNTTTSTQSNPSYAFFKTAMTSGKSATLSYRIYVYDSSGNVVSSGHTVNVFGYCQALYSSTVSNYLIVSDGWNTGFPRYINITSTDFIDTYGVIYNVA